MRGEDLVIRSAIGNRLGRRERHNARIDNLEGLGQLIGGEAGPIRIGAPNVRMAVEQPVVSNLFA